LAAQATAADGSRREFPAELALLRDCSLSQLLQPDMTADAVQVGDLSAVLHASANLLNCHLYCCVVPPIQVVVLLLPCCSAVEVQRPHIFVTFLGLSMRAGCDS
jgi:hypothetical protein